MAIEITRVTDPKDEHWQAILKPLHAYNLEKAGPSKTEPIALILRDTEHGEGLGGLYGHAYWDWLYIDLLFVPEPARRQGIGSELLARAESFARAKHCVGIWLDSFTFQAPDFYRKHGYEAFGTLDHYPNEESRVFLRKLLGPAPRIQPTSGPVSA